MLLLQELELLETRYIYNGFVGNSTGGSLDGPFWLFRDLQDQPWLACCLAWSALGGGGSTREGRWSSRAGRRGLPSACIEVVLNPTSVLALWPSLWSTNQQRSAFNKSVQSESLGDAAREARERLDERLRAQRTSEIRRHNSTGSLRPNGNHNNLQGMMSSGVLAKLQREVFCSKKSTRSKFSWSRLGWKAADQDVCAVCLEEFKGGDILVHLPCAHRFHWRCVLPWLESNSHCPCCRTEITS